jgi:hypothetical protein
MGAFGGYERGWEHVRARLDWASRGIAGSDLMVESVASVVNDGLAYTVDLEHMTRHVDDHPKPTTLRSTHAYRRENDQWRIVLRHADDLSQKDERQS